MAMALVSIVIAPFVEPGGGGGHDTWGVLQLFSLPPGKPTQNLLLFLPQDTHSRWSGQDR